MKHIPILAFILLIPISVFAVSSSSSINFLSKEQADISYCQQNGPCNITVATVTNQTTHLINATNMTVDYLNVTEKADIKRIDIQPTGLGYGVLMNGAAFGFGSTAPTTPPYVQFDTTSRKGVGYTLGSHNLSYFMGNAYFRVVGGTFSSPAVFSVNDDGDIYSAGKANTTEYCLSQECITDWDQVNTTPANIAYTDQENHFTEDNIFNQSSIGVNTLEIYHENSLAPSALYVEGAGTGSFPISRVFSGLGQVYGTYADGETIVMDLTAETADIENVTADTIDISGQSNYTQATNSIYYGNGAGAAFLNFDGRTNGAPAFIDFYFNGAQSGRITSGSGSLSFADNLGASQLILDTDYIRLYSATGSDFEMYTRGNLKFHEATSGIAIDTEQHLSNITYGHAAKGPGFFNINYNKTYTVTTASHSGSNLYRNPENYTINSHWHNNKGTNQSSSPVFSVTNVGTIKLYENVTGITCSSATEGEMYYDYSTHKAKICDGTTWQDLY